MRCTCQSELCHRPSESTGSVNSCIEGNCPFVICPTQSDTLSARLVFFFSSGISHPEALSLSIDWSLSSRRHRVLPSRRVSSVWLSRQCAEFAARRRQCRRPYVALESGRQRRLLRLMFSCRVVRPTEVSPILSQHTGHIRILP
jgi:hypothetical protein